MDIDNNKILICNCENTMEIDGESITQGCQSKTNCNVNNNLCGSELNVVLEELENSKRDNKNLFVACTQEQQTFEKLAEDNNFNAPKTFNIREYAGWSKDCLLYTSPSPRDATLSRMPSSA